MNPARPKFVKWFPLLIALAGIGLFCANAGDYFRSDDFVYISNVNTGITQMFNGENLGGSPFYRPLTLLTFKLDHGLWGINPLGYHLTNLLMFGAVIALFYLLLLLMFDDYVLALFGGLIFAIHPARAGSAAWISGRTDVLCGLFVLGTLVAYLLFIRKEKGGWHWYALSLASAMMALFSKENAIILPLLIVAVDLLFPKQQRRNGQIYAVIPFFILAIFYLALRTRILGGIGGYGLIHLQFGLFVIRNFAWYCAYFLLPVDYFNLAPTILQYKLPATIALIGVFALAVFLLRKQLKTRPALFGLLLIAITFVPIGNLFPEHRHSLTVHFGLAAFAAAIVAPLFKLAGKKRFVVFAIITFWVTMIGAFAINASAISRTASALSEKVVKQCAAAIDKENDPVTLIAVTLPDTYRRAFVLRNGLHQALNMIRPNRVLVAHRLALAGLDDPAAPGLSIQQISGVHFAVSLPVGGSGYLLLPDAIWSRHQGDTAVLGPVGYRITDEDRPFRVNGLEMIVDESFISRPNTVIMGFQNGNMTTVALEE